LIEYLHGKLLAVVGDHVVLDVGGVGYGLDVPQTTLDRLPAVGEEVELYTSLVVREDAMKLYGFRIMEERTVFEIFLGISGIGPRTALDVISTVSILDFVKAIETGNVNILTRIPGIGRKKAERMIVELKDKVGQFPISAGIAAESSGAEAAGAQKASEPDLYEDAVAALQGLGYKPAVAAKAVTMALRVLDSPEAELQEVVKQALQLCR
jgi:holliday junction DNA helicase RuvA